MSSITLPSRRASALSEAAKKPGNGSQPTAKTADFDPDDLLGKIKKHGELLRQEMNKHIIGQEDLIFAQIAAYLTDINLNLIGDTGVAKTHSSEVMMEILGIKGQTFPLNPDITVPNLLGMMSLDLETRQKFYDPSPFLGDDLNNKAIVLDEINSASDKVQDALLYVFQRKRIIVDKRVYQLGDNYTIVCTMNPPEYAGTRAIIGRLADRFQYSLFVEEPNEQERLEIIRYQRQQPEVQSLTEIFESYGYSAEKIILDCRQIFQYFWSRIDYQIDQIANKIVGAFNDRDQWEIRATVRTAGAITKMATAHSLLKRGEMPCNEDIWKIAPGCLGMLKHRDYLSTSEQRALIQQTLNKLKSKLALDHKPTRTDL